MAKGFSELSEGVQAVILVVIALVVAGLVLWFYALPEVAKRDALHAQWVKLKVENDKNEAFKQEQTEYLSRIQQLTQQLQTLRSIVPDKPDTDVFVKSVYDAGVSADIHLRSFAAHAVVQQPLYVEMPFEVHVDGTYYALLNFFDRLAHEQRIVTVSGLTLGRAGGGGGYTIGKDETVGANCLITTYYNAPQAPPGAKRPAPKAIGR